jgi:hypothetical protein
MGKRGMRCAARVAAWLLLANGLLGLGLGLWGGLSGAFTQALPWLGVLSGLLSMRRHRAGAWGAMLFYGLQLASFYPYTGNWSFSYRCGLSLGYVARLPDGVLVVNLVALLLLAVSAALAVRESRQARAATLQPALSSDAGV